MCNECGADAQRLDREMREEMQRDHGMWDALGRMDTLRSEEGRAASERFEREYLEQARPRAPKIKQGQEREQEIEPSR